MLSNRLRAVSAAMTSSPVCSMTASIVLSEDVNSASASVIVAQLLYLEGQDPEKDIYLLYQQPRRLDL
mgnify:CR=1 FL=1